MVLALEMMITCQRSHASGTVKPVRIENNCI